MAIAVLMAIAKPGCVQVTLVGAANGGLELICAGEAGAQLVVEQRGVHAP